MTQPAPPSPDLRGAAEVFRAFLRLGLTSFGGPIAHLGYFREAFVVRRGWLDEARFAQLLAVCQFLPGPASSQMGFAIGLLRAGWGGALAAFAGFTLPSALLMLAFAGSVSRLERGVGAAALHGLKLVAVVVVAQGVAGMARRMTPDPRRAAIAAAAAGTVLGLGTAWAQLAAIALGAALGALLCRRAPAPADAGFAVPYGHGLAYALLAAALLGLLVALSVPPAPQATPAALAAAFYRAGALVFGGGHVVLPLLEQSLVDPGWLDAGTFLAGYGAAQAMPGPMFTIATFLGAQTPTGLPAPAGAALATLALFLPGFLLLLAALPLWGALVRLPRAAALLAGVNAAVVGLLAAALYDPLWTQGVRDRTDLGIVAVGLALVLGLKRSALWALAWCTAASVATHLLAG